jgi:hypothetical protein
MGLDLIHTLNDLNNFLNIVENDTSSLLYYTRCFDSMILDYIFNNHLLIEHRSMLSNSDNMLVNVLKDLTSVFYSLSPLFFFFIDSFFFFNFVTFFIFDVNFFIFNNWLIVQHFSSIQKINYLVFNYLDIFVYFDFFFILTELLLLFSLVLAHKQYLKNLITTTRFYDDLITFFKNNGLSLNEFLIVFTYFFSFFLLDIFISFSDNDVYDFLFFYLFIFIIFSCFFIIVIEDVQYYYMISNSANTDFHFRILLFDFINNFLCLLRVFFCWIRYIFYDIQLEFVDLTYHYVDFSNDYYFIFLSDEQVNKKIFNWYHFVFFYIYYTFMDISFFFVQAWFNLLKIIIACYLLWLILDLFILRVFGYRESTRLQK